MSTSSGLDRYPENFFEANIYLQKIAGVWLPRKEIPFLGRIMYYVYLFFIYFVAFSFFLCEILMLKHTATKVSLFASHIGMLFTHFIGMMKLYLLLRCRKRISIVYGLLQDKQFHYEATEDFRPGEIMTEEKNKSGFVCKTVSIYCIQFANSR